MWNETGYQNGNVISRGSGSGGAAFPDGVFGVNQATPELFFDLKTGLKIVQPNWLPPLPSGRGRGRYDATTTLQDAESAMHDIAELIHLQAEPLFATLGTLPGYTAEIEKMNDQDNSASVNLLDELFCLYLIQGDTDRALTIATITETAGRADGRDWAVAIADRVTANAILARQDPSLALENLWGYTQRMRALFRIPEPDGVIQNP